MENLRTINLLPYIIIGGTLFVYPLFGFAYDEKTTHPALTQEMVRFFNQSFPLQHIVDSDQELIIQGSIEEDSGARWLHHFYDPVHKGGLVLEDAGFTKNPNLAFIGASARTSWKSSKVWADDAMLQNNLSDSLLGGIVQNYFSGTEDYSWERAVYDYAWGDKNRGLVALGHVLHLLEDASVPDHTRNDPHPHVFNMGSPYEDWAKQVNRQNISLAENLQDKQPVILNSIEDYFDTLANYSNNNFFSKDTIFSNDYIYPKVDYLKVEEINPGIFRKYGYKKINDIPLKIVGYSSDFDWKINIKDKFFIDDNKILSGYWSLLSKQAVLHGSGAIKLFFDEAAKERQTKTLYNKNRSWLSRKFDSLSSGIFGVARILYGSSVTSADLQDDTAVLPLVENDISPVSAPETSLSNPQQASLTPTETSLQSAPIPQKAAILQPPLPIPSQTSVKTSPPNSPSPSSNTSNSLPIAGVGGVSPSPSPSSQQNASDFLQTKESDLTPPTASTSSPPTETPNPPVITFPALDKQTFTFSKITFKGTANMDTTVFSDFSSASTSVNSFGAWSLLLNFLPEGEKTISFFAKNIFGALSDPTSRTIFIDSVAPSLSFSIKECDGSLATDGCLLYKPQITLELASSAPDFNHFAISCMASNSACTRFDLASTTASSTIYILPFDHKIYTFSAKAVDNAGNESSTTVKTVEYSSRPIVINEIAWAGTNSIHTADEWIELYNPTNQTINMQGITFHSLTDEKPSILLSGNLPAGGYYIIERTDDNTISDVQAGMIASFGSGSGAGLSNLGEVLALELGHTILDETPDIDVCNGWCAGNASGNYVSMERIDPFGYGKEKTNWTSWIAPIQNGKAADNTLINGTPGKKNSISYFIDPSVSRLMQDKTLTKANSPYIVTGEFTIPLGKTLTLEPGVVIKFLENASFLVDGSLQSKGTKDENVVLTSIKDDEFAGDTNQDGVFSSPSAGNWGTVKVIGSAFLDHTRIHYGGFKDWGRSDWALVHGENCNITLTNSVLEFSGAFGVWLKECNGILENNRIQHNTMNGNAESCGLVSTNSTLAVRGNTFLDNYSGAFMYATDNLHTVSLQDNSFIENKSYAIELAGTYPLLSGNIALRNGINGIFVPGGALQQNYIFTSDMPYIMQDLTIPSGSMLTLEAGAILKFNTAGGLLVYGALQSNGEENKPVVLTSYADDDCGIPGGCGDTNGTTTSLSIGDWQNISFFPNSNGTLSYTTIRYGGGNNNWAPFAALRIDSASVTLDHVIIEHNRRGGVFMQQAQNISIKNSQIQHHSKTAGENDFGIYLQSSSTPLIQNTIFRDNKTHIYNDLTSAFIDGGGNIFE